MTNNAFKITRINKGNLNYIFVAREQDLQVSLEKGSSEVPFERGARTARSLRDEFVEELCTQDVKATIAEGRPAGNR